MQSNRHSRSMAFVISAFSFAAFAIFGFQLFAVYAFSTMVDPDLPEAERSRIIADNLLFHDGPTQIVLVFVFSLIASTGLASTVVHLAVVLCGSPAARTATLLSASLGLAGAVTLIGVFLVRRI